MTVMVQATMSIPGSVDTFLGMNKKDIIIFVFARNDVHKLQTVCICTAYKNVALIIMIATTNKKQMINRLTGLASAF